MCKVNNHPHHLRPYRSPPAITILQTPSHRAQRTQRRAQAPRDQRHRRSKHAAKCHLHHPLLHQRRGTQLQTLLRRHLLRHPFDPHLRRNGVLLSLQLLRLQLPTLHSRVVRLGYGITTSQKPGSLPWRIPGHQSSTGGYEPDGDCKRTGARGAISGFEPATTEP